MYFERYCLSNNKRCWKLDLFIVSILFLFYGIQNTFQMTSILVTLKLFLIFWEDLQICEGCDMVVSSRYICSDVLSQSAWSILPVYFWIIPRTTRIISNLWLTQEWYFVFGVSKVKRFSCLKFLQEYISWRNDWVSETNASLFSHHFSQDDVVSQHWSEIMKSLFIL